MYTSMKELMYRNACELAGCQHILDGLQQPCNCRPVLHLRPAAGVPIAKLPDRLTSRKHADQRLAGSVQLQIGGFLLNRLVPSEMPMWYVSWSEGNSLRPTATSPNQYIMLARSGAQQTGAGREGELVSNVNVFKKLSRCSSRQGTALSIAAAAI